MSKRRTKGRKDERTKGGITIELWRTLRRMRIDLRLSAKAAAELMEVPRQTYYNWEQNRNLPSFGNLTALIACFPAYAERLQNSFKGDKLKCQISVMEAAYD